MRYLSLFSGIEAATAAWQPLGWEAVAFSEIEEFPNAVLEHHYPEVPNLGDVTKITESQIKKLGQIDIVVFGSPCQDLSIAGQRKGFEGERSCLFRNAIQIIKWAKKHCKCRFALWENVPGAFSSNKGYDFLEVLQLFTGAEHTLPEKGWQTAGVAYGKAGFVEWRTLNAQYFGVPQRRRRVFALADFGNWSDREPILFEPKSMSGDLKSCEQEREEIARCLTARPNTSNREDSDTYVVDTFDFQSSGEYGTANVSATLSATLSARDYKSAKDLVVHGSQDPIVSDKAHATGRNNGLENVISFAEHSDGQVRITEGHGQVTGTLCCGSGGTPGQSFPVISFSENSRCEVRSNGEVSSSISTGGGKPGQGYPAIVDPQYGVRRLTPIECERLQGFTDNFTQIPYRGKDVEFCPIGPRYKALGNSIAVVVLVWIGERIESELERIRDLA
ncbi:DNA (cytosine-5-)-methyltransferase [Alteromonadaceae bacterium M269]|nr:DNA (cytosine-5-)-methyltransferase [Alteromonadaceae bacterium M269]